MAILLLGGGGPKAIEVKPQQARMNPGGKLLWGKEKIVTHWCRSM